MPQSPMREPVLIEFGSPVAARSPPRQRMSPLVRLSPKRASPAADEEDLDDLDPMDLATFEMQLQQDMMPTLYSDSEIRAKKQVIEKQKLMAIINEFLESYVPTQSEVDALIERRINGEPDSDDNLGNIMATIRDYTTQLMEDTLRDPLKYGITDDSVNQDDDRRLILKWRLHVLMQKITEGKLEIENAREQEETFDAVMADIQAFITDFRPTQHDFNEMTPNDVVQFCIQHINQRARMNGVQFADQLDKFVEK